MILGETRGLDSNFSEKQKWLFKAIILQFE
jgi:hypothetical protein